MIEFDMFMYSHINVCQGWVQLRMYKVKYTSFDMRSLKERIASAQLVLFKGSSGVLGAKQAIRESFFKGYHA